MSAAEATRTGEAQQLTSEEAVRGFRELQRHGIVREEHGAWSLTIYGEQFERELADRRSRRTSE